MSCDMISYPMTANDIVSSIQALEDDAADVAGDADAVWGDEDMA